MKVPVLDNERLMFTKSVLIEGRGGRGCGSFRVRVTVLRDMHNSSIEAVTTGQPAAKHCPLIITTTLVILSSKHLIIKHFIICKQGTSSFYLYFTLVISLQPETVNLHL